MQGLTPHRWADDSPTKSAVAASLIRNPAFEVGTKGWRTHPLFVRDTELPDFDFPTWSVRHRPYDYETDGCE